jgi:hypothetical protein
MRVAANSLHVSSITAFPDTIDTFEDVVVLWKGIENATKNGE